MSPLLKLFDFKVFELSLLQARSPHFQNVTYFFSCYRGDKSWTHYAVFALLKNYNKWTYCRFFHCEIGDVMGEKPEPYLWEIAVKVVSQDLWRDSIWTVLNAPKVKPLNCIAWQQKELSTPSLQIILTHHFLLWVKVSAMSLWMLIVCSTGLVCLSAQNGNEKPQHYCEALRLHY